MSWTMSMGVVTVKELATKPSNWNRVNLMKMK